MSWFRRKPTAPDPPDPPDHTGPEPSVRDALLAPRPSDTLMRWALTGYLNRVLPDLAALRGISQSPGHRDDAFIHTLKVVDAIDPTPTRRWAALLHDIGKAPTFIEAPEGRSRFFDHDRIGALMVEEIMPAAGESPELTAHVQRLVSLHMRPISYDSAWSDNAVRRLREEAEEGRGKDGWHDLLALARADLRGYLPEPIDRGLWVLDSLEAHLHALDEQERRASLLEETAPKSPLDGDELMQLTGREAGPWIAELKNHLLREVTAGNLQRDDKSTAAQLALHYLNTHQPET